MTDKEKAIVMAHTGICMLTGDKFQIFHQYVEDIMGRPIMTHEIGWLADTIKEKSKDDFLVLCAEQEPCNDAISRKALIERINKAESEDLNEIIVLHDKYTNEPIIIRVSAINVIKKEIMIIDENKREEYTGITVGNIYYAVEEDIGVVMMKIKAAENKYISGKEKNNEKLC